VAREKYVIRIEKRVAEAVGNALQSVAAGDESLLESIKDKTDRYLVFNSSFLYRDKRLLKTYLSPRRLVVKMASNGKYLNPDGIWTTERLSLKAHYRILSLKDIPDKTSLSDAIIKELGSLGDLVFVLIGTIKGLRPSSKKIEGACVKELRLAPSIKEPIEAVDAGVYAVKTIVPIEDLLAHLAGDFESKGGLTEPERQKIADAYDKLLDDAITDVVLPTRAIQAADETILGQILSSLRVQIGEYRNALGALHRDETDNQALNEILRLAYNFSTDVIPLIFLFMSICDLKPIVFWCTIDQQWALYRTFALLPWSALGRKENLEGYRQIIAQARNHAFHHILPFDATVEADLSSFDVRVETIRLFAAFGQNQSRGIRIKDQALADVLADFSRAKQRPVSKLFWESNLSVMEAACNLAQGILGALILMHEARPQFTR
jgi:hypothetical protein